MKASSVVSTRCWSRPASVSARQALRRRAASERVGLDGLRALTDDLTAASPNGERPDTALLDGMLAEVVRRNGGPLTDDVALCLVSIPSRVDG